MDHVKEADGTQVKHHRVRNTAIGILVALVALGGLGFWKAGATIGKISIGNGSIFGDVMKSLPGVEAKLKGEEDGRINVVLLGMRGEHVDGGGLLADTVMVLSIHPKNGEQDRNRASLVSIPRDLYVTVPDTSDRQKINAVHHYGEQKGKGQGMEYMKRVLSDITGQPMHYAVAINFKGFTDLVDALGGVTVHLDQPFEEGVQFREPKVCDPYVFTVPVIDPKTKMQTYEHKYHVRKDGTKYIAKSYPLCYNKDVECGGVFKLSAGDNVLDGETALCYARARATSSDFERAKRQQEVIKELKEKMLSAGTLTDFSKINGLIDSLGDNVRTDMEGWEMKRVFDLYQKIGDAELRQKVLDTSDEGLLYFPDKDLYPGAGSIILPVGDNYDRIRELFRNLP
ncbi:MAG: LCP family protein [Candidatus Moranbacteria bacterium]|nr:LCP family protein [Candidatus Moranbacteria bacterium]